MNPKTNTNGTSISNGISNNSHKLVIELNKDQLVGLTQILKQLLLQKQVNITSSQTFTHKLTSSNFKAPASPTKQPHSFNATTQNQNIQLKHDNEEINEEEYDGAWYTDPNNHNNEPIQKMVFCKDVDGLSSDDGWVISTSKNLLVLWKCCPGEEDPLEMTHSFPIDERITSMDVCENTKVLAAAAFNTITNQSYISLYSLEGKTIFTSKYKLAPGAEVLQVASLQAVGGPLSLSLACAIQKDIVVYDVSPTTTTPRATWNAHNGDLLCCLKRNQFGKHLFSGSWNGSVHMWDLNKKPTAPAAKFLHHSRAITSAEMVSNNVLVTSSADSFLAVWDIRNSTNPVRTLSLDTKSVLNVKFSPKNQLLVVSTLKGLYVLSTSNYDMAPLTSVESKTVVPDMCFDKTANYLYAGSTTGEIAVYSDKHLMGLEFKPIVSN